MKKASSAFIDNLRYVFLIFVITFGLISIIGSGGGSSGDSGSYYYNFPPSPILDTYPRWNETDVPGYRLIFVKFDELMDDSTINESTFTLEDNAGNSVSGEVIFYDRLECNFLYCVPRGYAYFYPSNNLTPSTKYTATLSGSIQDEEGNDLGSGYNWSFTINADIGTGTWQTISTTGAPSEGTAVWTGDWMIVWNGTTGGRYNPNTNTWQTISTTGAPSGGTAVWTGNEMIVWNGTIGGRYNPYTNTWQTISATGAPSVGTAVWTGNEMIVWDGHNGGRYNPNTDTWQTISKTGAYFSIYGHTAVWTGTEMIIWGGCDYNSCFDTGARYDPSIDSWEEISSIGAPVRREGHTAVWTGNEMIVWGGSYYSSYYDTGGRYDPLSDSWEETSTIGAPVGRERHTAVWTGNEMIVWGGDTALERFGMIYLNSIHTGGVYYPDTNIWQETSTTNAPLGMFGHAAVWTGNEMIVWGETGGRYIP